MEYTPSIRQITKELESHMDKVAKDVILSSDPDPFRLYFLRPSSFPYCGLRFFLEFPERLEHPRLQGLASAYFTGVGSVTHEIFQRYTAKLGKVVGDWKCRSCGKKTKFDVYKACSCGGEKKYVELSLAYKNTVLGHSDALYRFSPKEKEKSNHIVKDYKTTSSRRVKEDKEAEQKGNKRMFPYKANVAQIETYIPLIEHQYKVTVDYWALVYLARDAPFQYGRRVIVHYVNAEEKTKLAKRLDKVIKIHRKTLQAKSMDDLEVIKKHKLCKSLDDYKKNWRDEFDECPYLDVCFKAKDLDAKLKTTLGKKIFPIIEQAPKKVRKVLKL